MGRPKLPASEKKVRVVIYAKAGHVSIAKAVAADRDMDLSRFTDKIYEKAAKLYRTQKAEPLQT